MSQTPQDLPSHLSQGYTYLLQIDRGMGSANRLVVEWAKRHTAGYSTAMGALAYAWMAVNGAPPRNLKPDLAPIFDRAASSMAAGLAGDVSDPHAMEAGQAFRAIEDKPGRFRLVELLLRERAVFDHVLPRLAAAVGDDVEELAAAVASAMGGTPAGDAIVRALGGVSAAVALPTTVTEADVGELATLAEARGCRTLHGPGWVTLAAADRELPALVLHALHNGPLTSALVHAQWAVAKIGDALLVTEEDLPRVVALLGAVAAPEDVQALRDYVANTQASPKHADVRALLARILDATPQAVPSEDVGEPAGVAS